MIRRLFAATLLAVSVGVALDPAGNRNDLTSLNAYVPRLWVLNPVQS